MYRHPIHDIGFIAHPKTASTSAAKALEAENWWAKRPHHEVDEPYPKHIISVIREPRDWYTSWFFHIKGHRDNDIGPFDEWLERFIREAEFPTTPPFYGLPHTTHLVFYERLQEGLNAALIDLGLQPIELGFHNVRHRDGRPASEFFTETSEKLLDPTLILTYDSLREKLGDQPYLKIRCSN
jgi:hypothetical protein